MVVVGFVFCPREAAPEAAFVFLVVVGFGGVFSRFWMRASQRKGEQVQRARYRTATARTQAKRHQGPLGVCGTMWPHAVGFPCSYATAVATNRPQPPRALGLLVFVLLCAINNGTGKCARTVLLNIMLFQICAR